MYISKLVTNKLQFIYSTAIMQLCYCLFEGWLYLELFYPVFKAAITRFIKNFTTKISQLMTIKSYICQPTASRSVAGPLCREESPNNAEQHTT